MLNMISALEWNSSSSYAGNGPKRSNPWISCPRPNPGANIRLFCFPYAGGGASIFHSWGANLPQEIEVCAVQLPGRENRLREPPYSGLQGLVQRLTGALSPLLDRPFAFFGHSMGALISFELTRNLRRQGLRGPAHLLVSAHRAPARPYPLPPLSQIPTRDLIEQLRYLGGTPDELLKDNQMMQFLLPVLRADFSVCETYTYLKEPPLDCAISAFGGLRDRYVSREDLADWQTETHGTVMVELLPGGHFFIHQEREQLLQSIRKSLLQHCSLSKL